MAKKKAKAKPKKKEPIKTGRPSKYTPEVAKLICESIAQSDKGLRHICLSNNTLPDYATVIRWLGEDDKIFFRDQYARAREEQSDFIFDMTFEIASGSSKGDSMVKIQRDKLKIDTIKWQASKLKPKKYGDKIDLGIGDTEISVTIKKKDE